MSEPSQTNNRTSNKPNAMHLETSIKGILMSEQCDYKIPCNYTLYVEPRDLYDGCYIIGRSLDCGSETEAQVTIEEKIAVLDLARVPTAINHMLSYPEVRYTRDVTYVPVA